MSLDKRSFSSWRCPFCNQFASRAEAICFEEDLNLDIQSWQLIPQSAAKVFPDYVPPSIIQDYREACLIRDLSPKASATLARRALQGMIRDFWGISKARLVDEIDALEEKVDSSIWRAIKGVKDVGNIGAHMEKDINTIIDVDPDEASQLIWLIETLIQDWYILRAERHERLKQIEELASRKKSLKTGAQAADKAAPASPVRAK